MMSFKRYGFHHCGRDRDMKTAPRPASRRSPLSAILAALLLACVLSTIAYPALAAGGPAGSWSDTFDTTRRIQSFSGTKVSGGSLSLAEAAPSDLGAAVPGESAVYASVSLGDDVYTGTGEKGHLVRFRHDELYQEGFTGPSHWGVSNSKGQVVAATETRVAALATDGTSIYGGTHPSGHVFTFSPAPDGKRSHDNGTCSGASGAVLSMAWGPGVLYCGTDSGDVFTYSGGVDGSFTDLGQPAGATPIRSMIYAGGALYAGTGSGHLYKYDGSFTFRGIHQRAGVDWRDTVHRGGGGLRRRRGLFARHGPAAGVRPVRRLPGIERAGAGVLVGHGGGGRERRPRLPLQGRAVER
jgi:hypothetical protein